MEFTEAEMDRFHDNRDVFASYYTADDVRNVEERTVALAALLLTRTDWPRLQVMENEHGNWDIVVRVDGGYGDREHALETLAWYATKAAKIQTQATLPKQIGPADA